MCREEVTVLDAVTVVLLLDTSMDSNGSLVLVFHSKSHTVCDLEKLTLSYFGSWQRIHFINELAT